MTSRDPKGQTCVPNTLRAEISKTAGDGILFGQRYDEKMKKMARPPKIARKAFAGSSTQSR